MNSTQGPSDLEYEAALAEERLAWKQLDEPAVDVNERVKAAARWSAAAERARAMARRLHGTAPSRERE